jgi:hypothetical protein
MAVPETTIGKKKNEKKKETPHMCMDRNPQPKKKRECTECNNAIHPI